VLKGVDYFAFPFFSELLEWVIPAVFLECEQFEMIRIHAILVFAFMVQFVSCRDVSIKDVQPKPVVC
jgi:hypothetical protein